MAGQGLDPHKSFQEAVPSETRPIPHSCESWKQCISTPTSPLHEQAPPNLQRCQADPSTSDMVEMCICTDMPIFPEFPNK